MWAGVQIQGASAAVFVCNIKWIHYNFGNFITSNVKGGCICSGLILHSSASVSTRLKVKDELQVSPWCATIKTKTCFSFLACVYKVAHISVSSPFNWVDSSSRTAASTKYLTKRQNFLLTSCKKVRWPLRGPSQRGENGSSQPWDTISVFHKLKMLHMTLMRHHWVKFMLNYYLLVCTHLVRRCETKSHRHMFVCNHNLFIHTALSFSPHHGDVMDFAKPEPERCHLHGCGALISPSFHCFCLVFCFLNS